MKYLIISVAFLLGACNNVESDYKEATNALDAGREFIDACLKGDFAKAEFYMLKDDTNKMDLQKIEREYRTKDREGRMHYREASINIIEIASLNENETIINYSNSYDKIGHKVKVIEINNKWVVDFKYTFNPNL